VEQRGELVACSSVVRFAMFSLTAVTVNTWDSSGLDRFITCTGGENVVLLNEDLGLEFQSFIQRLYSMKYEEYLEEKNQEALQNDPSQHQQQNEKSILHCTASQASAKRSQESESGRVATTQNTEPVSQSVSQSVNTTDHRFQSTG